VGVRAVTNSQYIGQSEIAVLMISVAHISTLAAFQRHPKARFTDGASIAIVRTPLFYFVVYRFSPLQGEKRYTTRMISYLCRLFFALWAKNNLQKKKRTMLPQAMIAFASALITKERPI
jgi:hypothetical protein